MVVSSRAMRAKKIDRHHAECIDDQKFEILTGVYSLLYRGPFASVWPLTYSVSQKVAPLKLFAIFSLRL